MIDLNLIEERSKIKKTYSPFWEIILLFNIENVLLPSIDVLDLFRQNNKKPYAKQLCVWVYSQWSSPLLFH